MLAPVRRTLGGLGVDSSVRTSGNAGRHILRVDMCVHSVLSLLSRLFRTLRESVESPAIHRIQSNRWS